MFFAAISARRAVEKGGWQNDHREVGEGSWYTRIAPYHTVTETSGIAALPLLAKWHAPPGRRSGSKPHHLTPAPYAYRPVRDAIAYGGGLDGW